MAAKRYSLIFYAAIIVALVSTFGVYRVLEVTKANARVATAPVVIAQKDLPEAASIDRMAVVVAQWPVGTIPAGAFTSIDSVAGRVTRVAVFKGEALVPGRLAPDGTGAARSGRHSAARGANGTSTTVMLSWPPASRATFTNSSGPHPSSGCRSSGCGR